MHANQKIPGIAYTIITAIVLLALQISAEEICTMRLLRCPEDFNDSTIYVPKKVYSMASNFFVCMPVNFVEGADGGGSPSIMFVIDHSGSMSGLTGNAATDTAGSRFKVTRALIDTIKNKYPGAEVGMIIFQNLLYLDTQNQPYAVPLPSSYPFPAGVRTQGYIPLMPLDSMLNDTLSVVDMLKGLLETKKVPKPNSGGQTTTDLVYKPLHDKANGFTNINTAFDAAKYAMLQSRYAKENQFIIFLSDGEPMPQSTGAELHGGKDPNDYENAVDVPTTFTVYFVTNNSDRVPDRIRNMTENVRVNNYSTNNYLSNVWGIRTSYDTLLNVLMTQAISPIFTSIRKQPTKLILNNVTYNQYNTRDSSFYIPNLSLKDSVTDFNLRINYTIKVDSTTQTKDTLSQIKFTVVRTNTRPVTEGISIDCSDTVFYTVTVSATTATANEKGPSNGTFQFTRNNSDHGDLVVYFKITGTAIHDLDYTRIADSVVFTGTQKTVTVQVRPLPDSLKEDDETVIVTLLDTKQGRLINYKSASPSTATVTIKDNYTPLTKPDTISIRIIQNPFTIRENNPGPSLIDLLPQNKRAKYQSIIGNKNGILVSVFSNRKLKPVSENSFGKAVLYDGVGNIVNELKLQSSNTDTTLYGFVWDGTNSSNRLVGTGTYLMRMKVANSSGRKKILSEKLGVR
jgi:hypothetical protein